MNERRRGLEKVNASVEPAKDGRRPQLALEASNIRTGSGRRGSGVDMCSKEKRVNMGSPPWREERSQPEIREEQAGLRRVAERSVVAMKRVMIVERRDLSSRATSEVQKGIAIGHRPSNLVNPRQIQMTFDGLSEGEAWLHRMQERCALVRKPDARKSHIRFDERDLETEETVRYSDTDMPKGSETVTAEPNSTAPDLDSTRHPIGAK
jgi:hypothetical protein